MTKMEIDYQPLREQIDAIVKEFGKTGEKPHEILNVLLSDVERAMSEPLEIFPVTHHSPASALQLIKRLRSRPVKVIYLETCEDLIELVPMLTECELPVAFQALANRSRTFPASQLPLSVIAPLTEMSAEYQAIAFGILNQDVEIVFIDRSTDHIFQRLWADHQTNAKEAPEDEELTTTIGLQMGDMAPSLEKFVTFLLKNARVRHFSEWWNQYVDQVVLGSDYQTYRQIMFLIGSLIRRLGTNMDRLKDSRWRERYMWTRIKEHMQEHGIKPDEAIFICGAAHTVCDVPEFGVESSEMFDIPQLSDTDWLHGVIPVSFSMIERQFGQPLGTASISERAWKKGLNATGVRPFSLKRKEKETQKHPHTPNTPVDDEALLGFLTKPPAFLAEDERELIQNCMEIVALARNHGYLATTADSIAIFETSKLLANLRQRNHPTFYDFQDAAVTCLEKDYVPKTKDIFKLCQEMIALDVMGSVGYTALPPLVKEVYDVLGRLKDVDLTQKRIQRALMDFRENPDLLQCSNVLWRIKFLLPSSPIVKPIMGELELGKERLQESWDLRFRNHQAELIQLGYEGISLEQVITKRMRTKANRTDIKSGEVLQLVKDSILLLDSPRFSEELGKKAEERLMNDSGIEDAPENFRLIRELVYYYQTTPGGIPLWVKSYIATGYSYYTASLPQTFDDRGTTPEQIAASLSFALTLENFAVMMGCDRSQLIIALRSVNAPTYEIDPRKLGLLMTAEWYVRLRDMNSIREFFNNLFSNPLLLEKIPDYVMGFVLALPFAPGIAELLIEVLSRVYATVPNRTLIPWLMKQLLQVRTNLSSLIDLTREAAQIYPIDFSELETWQAPWETQIKQSDHLSLETEPSTIDSEKSVRLRDILSTHSSVIQMMLQSCNIDED
ncbi:MAG: hypothetical protein BAJATHORv1_10557 [Candidatus Thorarchaeota archaeon]|nr:MAG: hypothetical protein BAJATHORv1_10557 [Candidatus Thorarchaeota archaeon]